ncbi:uncharacterized protein LOC113318246 [Papaver somniferum]|uniref:uncharacterized protein LOC113318246 n=1 Tax=Papaver somniferum TaxID=3469 RepID=UPI000E6FD8AC|nr:uncharacterized protein LOC113318246 [Papaver somniferum]
MDAEMDLEEKWVQMNGKLVPIIKLERLARDDLDGCIKWYKFWMERINSPSQNSCLRRWSKNMDKALKRLKSIQFIRYTSPSLPPPFRVKEISTDICDSSVELIPSYFFEEMVDSTNSLSSQAEEVSTVVNSIPSAVNEEEVSLNLWSNGFKIWEVNQFTNELLVRNCVKFFSEHREYVDFLNELLFLHSKILGMAYIHFKLDDSRLLFDRGKYFGTLILSSGFKSDYGFLDSIIHVFAKDTEIRNDSKMFVKMPKRESGSLSSDRDDFVLQLHQDKMFVKTFPLDTVCFEYKFFFNHTLHTRKSSQGCLWSADKVFDRGKEFQLLKGLFSFNCESEDYLDAITSSVIVILGYCFDLLLEYSNMTLFVQNGDSYDDSQMFHNRPQQSNVP